MDIILRPHSHALKVFWRQIVTDASFAAIKNVLSKKKEKKIIIHLFSRELPVNVYVFIHSRSTFFLDGEWVLKEYQDVSSCWVTDQDYGGGGEHVYSKRHTTVYLCRWVSKDLCKWVDEILASCEMQCGSASAVFSFKFYKKGSHFFYLKQIIQFDHICIC